MINPFYLGVYITISYDTVKKNAQHVHLILERNTNGVAKLDLLIVFLYENDAKKLFKLIYFKFLDLVKAGKIGKQNTKNTHY